MPVESVVLTRGITKARGRQVFAGWTRVFAHGRRTVVTRGLSGPRSATGTLGQLLKQLEDDIGLHPALKAAFSNLYGYTSDESSSKRSVFSSRNTELRIGYRLLATGYRL